jgi:GDP-mannose 6-dehydrogenase
MNISIFGLGYVGCVSLGCLTQNGHNVIGVDVVKNKVNLINKGKPTIVEKEIDTIIDTQHKKGRIKATTDYREAISSTTVSIICVGTPSSNAGHLNLDYVYKVAQELGESFKQKHEFHVVVIRSTVFPGTNLKIGKIIEDVSGKKRNVDFGVVSNPEFLREGSAVADYFNPPVTVIGSDSKESLNIMADIYKDLNGPIKRVDIKEAEIIKYVNNSFHALKITFANEIGNICKKLGIDSHKVMELFVLDKQLNISPYYFKPGYAYGGSCLPKDLKGLNTIAHDNYLSTPVLSAIEGSNTYQKQSAYEMVIESGNRKVGIIGLSFKQGTDDLRYSPAVELAERLLGRGYVVAIYDKNVNYTKLSGTNKDYIDRHIPHLSNLISGDFDEVISCSEIIVITQKDENINDVFLEKNQGKHIIDLIRLSPSLVSGKNYQGICW